MPQTEQEWAAIEADHEAGFHDPERPNYECSSCAEEYNERRQAEYERYDRIVYREH